MNSVNEQYLNNLIDTLQTERNNLVLALKNDTDLLKEKELTSKMTCIESLIRNSIKYRNIIIKMKLKSI